MKEAKILTISAAAISSKNNAKLSPSAKLLKKACEAATISIGLIVQIETPDINGQFIICPSISILIRMCDTPKDPARSTAVRNIANILVNIGMIVSQAIYTTRDTQRHVIIPLFGNTSAA